MKDSKVKPTELKYYPKQKSQCLSKYLFNVIVGLRRFSQKSYEPSFYELSRTKYRNLFLFTGQFRYVSTATNKETVENFGGNNIDTIKSWKSFLKFLDQQIFTNYVRKENGDFPKLSIAPFSELLKQIKVLNDSYCFLVSMLLKQNYDASITLRLSSKYIPNEIERMQQLFIESPAICLMAIHDLKSSSSSMTPGIDNVAFTSLTKKKQEYVTQKTKGTRYSKSSKTYKVKKDLPKAAVIDNQLESLLKKNMLIENDKLCWLLYKKCNIKSLKKNYRGSTVRRVWVPKLRSLELRSLGIPTLRDRVLQTVIHMSLMPIAEWQADPFSFGFRPKRSAVQLISLIADQLRTIGTVQPYRGLVKQVNYESYKKHKGLRHRVRSYLITKGANKRRRQYSYTYWIFIKKVKNRKSRETFSSYPRFINIDIEKYFDKIPHSSILEFIPIVNKYRFLLKAWLYAPIYCPKMPKEKGYTKIIPRCGVSQGSIISPLICNFVLNGLENYLLKNLSHRYQFNDEEINRIRQQFGQKKVEQYAKPSDWPRVRIRVYRYAYDILILGKASQEQFLDIYKRLVLFLKDRGLNVKEKKNPVKVFSPRAKFEFLGFQFQYPDYKNSQIDRGKYTRYSFSDPYMVLRGLRNAKHRNKLLITIDPKSYKSIMFKFKSLFSRNRTGLPVKVLIKDYNEWLIGVIKYFGLTRSTRIQLMKLNHLAFLRFKKLLLKKFSSKPKLRTFLRTKYYTSDCLVKDGTNIQLKVQNFIPYGGRPLHNIAPTIKSLRANIYLDHSLYIKNDQKKTLADAQQKLSMNRCLNAKEFRSLLHAMQGG
jgi:retron-type reverse transcriptase